MRDLLPAICTAVNQEVRDQAKQEAPLLMTDRAHGSGQSRRARSMIFSTTSGFRPPSLTNSDSASSRSLTVRDR